MDDLISRQALLEDFKTVHPDFKGWAEWASCIIQSQPSAQRTGEWIHDGSDWTNRWICSKCGYKHFLEKTNYCPNCGADMRGGDTNGND